VTGADAGLAAGAILQIHSESVLFSRARLVQRDEVAIVPGLGRRIRGFVTTSETFDGSEFLLLGKQIVNQCSRRIRFGHSRRQMHFGSAGLFEEETHSSFEKIA
jgi:hypothetical protein